MRFVGAAYSRDYLYREVGLAENVRPLKTNPKIKILLHVPMILHIQSR